MNKQSIENRIKEIDSEKKKLEKEHNWVSLPDKIRAEFHVGFGLPKIMQELDIERKLDKDTYKKLSTELAEICERIVRMIPEEKKSFWKILKSKYEIE